MRIIGARQARLFGGMALGIALGGCNSFDKAPEGDPNAPRLMIPVDEHAATVSPVTPPPISGGTLTATSDGAFAIVADPDRDRISIVDLVSRSVSHTIELSAGDEPGRSVEDSQKLIHVALRRSGAILDVDPQTGSVLARRAVWPGNAPRTSVHSPSATAPADDPAKGEK